MVPIKVTGMNRKDEENSINSSFDSIDKVIKAWKPKVTKQKYAIFTYYGPLKIDQKIVLTKDFPQKTMPIFAQNGSSSVFVGLLERSGVFTSLFSSQGHPIIISQPYMCIEERYDY